MIQPEIDSNLEQQLFENVAALPAFYELVGFASEVCLSRPERIAEIMLRERDHIGRERPYVNVWATKVALEVESNAARVIFKNRDPLYHISANEALANPGLFGPAPIAEVQQTIGAFGEALLEEAFESLGPDAEEQVIAWHKDSSSGSRIEIVTWLVKRVEDIRDKKPEEITENVVIDNFDIDSFVDVVTLVPVESESLPLDTDQLETLVIDLGTSEIVAEVEESETDTGDGFYHPARLSPKLLGTYPDTNTKPTCLAVSVLLASFLHKVGAPTLHAGVMRTASLEAKRSLMGCGYELKDFAERRDIDLPDDVEQNITRSEQDYTSVRDRNTGFHAAILTQIAKDYWICLDPNYHNNVGIGVHESQRLAELRRTIVHSSGGLGGVEVAHRNTLGAMAWLFEDSMEAALKQTPPDTDLEWLLDNLESWGDPMVVLKDYVRAIVLGDTPYESAVFLVIENSANVKSSQYVEKKTTEEVKTEAVRVIDAAIEGVIKQYLFPDSKGDDFSKSLDRCRRDDRYRQNRLDDLAFLPAMAVLRLLVVFTNELIGNNVAYPHSYVEVGLLRHRIGACVLSDFAAHCGDDLPPSFWTSHWASNIAWAEHSQRNTTNPAQYRTARNIARVLNTSWLTYHHYGEKIRAFLGQGAIYYHRGGE